MYYLDEKTSLLIQRLLMYTAAQSVSQIAKDLTVNRRVVYYHLDKINVILSEQKISPIVNDKKTGICLTSAQRHCLSVVMENHNVMYVLNTDERQLYFMFYIALAKQRVTIDKMMAVSSMSRNTVLSDVTAIRKYLENSTYDIVLAVNKPLGYHYSGKHMEFIRFLYALLNQIFESDNPVFLQKIKQLLLVHEDAQILLSDEFSKELNRVVYQQTSNLQKTFVNKDLQYALKLFPYFILALKNISDLTISLDLKEISKRLEYPISKNTLDYLSQKFAIEFSTDDIYFVTLMLLSVRKEYDGHVRSTDYTQLHHSLMNFIDLFENQANVQLDDKDEICNRLVMHFKTLLYRKKYNVFTYNPLTTMIKKQYEELFQIILTCSQILEKELMIQLSEEDVAYIAIHFGGVLRHQQKSVMQNKIIILTDEGKSIQTLLIEQCERYLQRVNIIAVLSKYDELASYTDFDMIVTTMSGVRHEKPVVLVNPIFQFNDILNVFRYSVQNKKRSKGIWEKIDAVLNQYVPLKEDRLKLNSALHQIFDEIL